MKRTPRNAGFSFIEIMIVMSIIGLLMALVGPRLMKGREKAESQAATVQVENLGAALDTFRLDVGRYPSTQEGLDALERRPSAADRWDGPYLKKSVPLDPWGRRYVYASPGQGGRPYDLYSLGADGMPGGDGPNRDVTSWESDSG
jgi:general secretion pathway protein G